jgi:hypothetical protein
MVQSPDTVLLLLAVKILDSKEIQTLGFNATGKVLHYSK